jgi:hypothetical protein
MARTRHVASVGGQEWCTQRFVRENWEKKNNLQDLGVNGRIILKRVYQINIIL